MLPTKGTKSRTFFSKGTKSKIKSYLTENQKNLFPLFLFESLVLSYRKVFVGREVLHTENPQQSTVPQPAHGTPV